METKIKYISSIFIVFLIILVTIFIPYKISVLNDSKIIDKKIFEEEINSFSDGLRYKLSNNEKLFIFSKARENLSLLGRFVTQSLKTEILRLDKVMSVLDNKNYALFLNEKGSGINEIPFLDLQNILTEEIKKLIDLKIIIDKDFKIEANFDAKLYSIANISDPAKNISVWEIIDKNNNWQFDIDAETGKIYSFEIILKDEFSWENLNINEIAKNFNLYHEVIPFKMFENNDATERTPNFKKFTSKSEDGEEIFLTVGLFPGNNSFFIRIP